MTDTSCIAIVHYHLRPGGVTRIIEQTADTLAARGVRLVVLSGAAPPGPWPLSAVPLRLVAGLNYDAPTDAAPGTLADRLQDAAAAALGRPPDVWHFHNHSLGRNISLIRAVRHLAARGAKLLLHIHDFPEDARPQNYRRMLHELGRGDSEELTAQLYPTANHVHYAVINSRDFRFLSAAGLPAGQCHLLANPVSATPVSATRDADRDPDADDTRRTFLYPTRAIRRKNMGELLLWAALARQGDRFAATLAPTSEADHQVYERWRSYARSTGLPVDFEVGLQTGASLPVLLRNARAVITTSVAEGFGLAFLEPWIAGRPLVGRNLPEITGDFLQAGVALDGLYDRLLVPLAWIGMDHYVQSLSAGMSACMKSYGRECTGTEIERALNAAMVGDRVDFGRLSTSQQATVIQRLVDEPAARDSISPASLDAGLQVAAKQVETNRHAISSHYSQSNYGDQLLAIYGSLAAVPSGPIQALRGDLLLDAFLAPERFCLLRM